MGQSFAERFKKMSTEANSVEFPECFFGVKGYNHVHDKILNMSVLCSLIALVSTVACFFWLENNAWTWSLGLLGIFFVTMLGNVFRIRWLYIPILIVIVGLVILWTFTVGYKLVVDLCRLNQPSLHYYFGAEIDRAFPPLDTNQRVQLLIDLVTEILLLLPVFGLLKITTVLSNGFLYLEQEQKKNYSALPIRVDPFIYSGSTGSDVSV